MFDDELCVGRKRELLKQHTAASTNSSFSCMKDESVSRKVSFVRNSQGKFRKDVPLDDPASYDALL